jgi:hypothetical protein
VADENGVSPDQFGALFKDFVQRSIQSAPSMEPYFLKALRSHFEADPRELATVAEAMSVTEHPNLHRAIKEYLAQPGLQASLGGVAGMQEYEDPSIAALLTSQTGTLGPVQYRNVPLANDEVLPCVSHGLYLVKGARREAILVAAPSPRSPWDKLRVEVMATTQEDAAATLSRLRRAMRERNVYRGHVLSLVADRYSNSPYVVFHALRSIVREDIILPPGLLDRIELHAVGFSKHVERMRASGRHLKRGLLLHGPPGTGKTLTAMYLAGQMRERTTFLITGQGLGLIEQACAMARLLQPATLIIEDVDLVAEERTHQSTCNNAILFELLNQMDGLAEDSDVLFLVTTNRPEILERALASRPGRVDLAVEVPLPDAEGRRRLVELYGRGLDLSGVDVGLLVRRTEGVSGAFVKELLRKAALFAADDGSPSVREAHVQSALHELTVHGGPLTQAILGGKARASSVAGA